MQEAAHNSAGRPGGSRVAAVAAPDWTAKPPRRYGDAVLGGLTRGSAALVLVLLAALLVVLIRSAWPSLRTDGAAFWVGTEWRPNELEVPVLGADGAPLFEDGELVTRVEPPVFGALPVIYGTAVSSVIALAFAVPLSLGAALFIVRVAPRLKIAGPVSFLVEFLAAIPSIAYGIWGLFVLGPFLREHVEPLLVSIASATPGLAWVYSARNPVTGEMQPIALTGKDMLAGGLILGVMILPVITAVSRDVLAAVPRAQIEGTLALGATWWQSCRAMLRYSRSGLLGAIILGLARAAGETMAVTMVIGNSNQISASVLAPAQTMASLLANEFAEVSRGSAKEAALMHVALLLLVLSLIFNVAARALVVGRGGAGR